LHHPVHVLGGPGIVLGALDVEAVQVLEEGLDVWSRDLGHGAPLKPGLADDLVLDIGDVHHLQDLVSPEAQIAAQEVLKDVGPEVPDVGEIVDRGPTGVQADPTRLQRMELLQASRHGIEEADRHDKGRLHRRRRPVLLESVGRSGEEETLFVFRPGRLLGSDLCRLCSRS